MQKKMGGVPEAMVSSELAAMFDLHVWPDLLKCYTQGPPLTEQASYAHYTGLCQEFAAKIGRPWTEVHYPFFISMDNCKKHPWLRKQMLRPRISVAERARLQAAVDRELEKQRRSVRSACYDKLLQDYVTSSGLPPSICITDRARETCAALADLQLEDEMAKHWAEHERIYKCTFAARVWHQLAWDMPWLRIIVPEQFMPLVECTPDIHCVVEHMVRTLKAYLRMCMWRNISALWYAKTYQDYMNEAVREKGNGESGRHHIRGSCRKQPQICKILAAEKNEVVVLQHQFGGPAKNPEKRPKRQLWVMWGQAGDYIPDTRWN